MTSNSADPSTKVTTRLATPADRAGVERLVARYREEFGHADRGAACPALGEGSVSVVLAEVGGEIAGMISAHRCYAFGLSEDYLLLSDIYVTPEHRRQKAASALMDGVKALAQQLGVNAMRLFVQDINEPALITAARSGFTRSRELVLCFGED